MLKARFKGSIARATKSATTVLKSVNVESVFFDLDSSWDGLVAWACFKCNENGTEYHLMMPANHEVTIPWEIFTTEGRLYVGAVGYRDSEIVKPTTWLYLADVVKGVDPEGSISVIPTPTAFEQAMAALGDATDALDAAVQGIPNTIDTALAEAKASGEFDGADGQDGNNLWLVAASDTREVGGTVQALKSGLVGPSGASVQRGDVFVVSDGRVCSVLAVAATLAFGTVLGDMRGPIDAELSSTSENAVQNKAVYAALLQASFLIDDKVDKEDGKGLSSNDYTDEDAQKVADAATKTWVNSQGFLTSANEIPPGGAASQVLKKASNADYDVEWADESGGGSVTVDDEISGSSTNPVQNKVIKAALDAKGSYSKPSGGIPASDMAPGVSAALGRAYTAVQPEDLEVYRTAAAQDVIDAGKGTYSKPSGGIPKTDLASAVQTSLGKADTALQQHQDISGKLNADQGAANAGKFLVVGSDGVVAPVTMTAWQGGNY